MTPTIMVKVVLNILNTKHFKFGAVQEIRTLDPNLGKVVLYH